MDVALDEIEGDWFLVEYVNSHDGKPIGAHTPYLCPEVTKRHVCTYIVYTEEWNVIDTRYIYSWHRDILTSRNCNNNSNTNYHLFILISGEIFQQPVGAGGNNISLCATIILSLCY